MKNLSLKRLLTTALAVFSLPFVLHGQATLSLVPQRPSGFSLTIHNNTDTAIAAVSVSIHVAGHTAYRYWYGQTQSLAPIVGAHASCSWSPAGPRDGSAQGAKVTLTTPAFVFDDFSTQGDAKWLKALIQMRYEIFSGSPVRVTEDTTSGNSVYNLWFFGTDRSKVKLIIAPSSAAPDLSCYIRDETCSASSNGFTGSDGNGGCYANASTASPGSVDTGTKGYAQYCSVPPTGTQMGLISA